MVDIINTRLPGDTTGSVGASDGGLGSVFSLLAKSLLDPNQALRAEQLTSLKNKNLLTLQARDAVANGLDKVNFDGLALPALTGDASAKGLGQLLLTRNANVYGAADPRTTNAAVGSGEDYKSTYGGTQDTLKNARTLQAMQEATKTRLAAATPTNVLDDNGLPVVVRQGESYGRAPVVGHSEIQGSLLRRDYNNAPNLPPAQQKAIGAEPAADKLFNWAVRGPNGQTLTGRTLDGGKTDADTKQPLPAGAMLVAPMNASGAGGMLAPPGNLSRGVSDGLIKARDSNRKVIDIATRMYDMAVKDPSIVGPAGNVQRGLQDVFDAGNGLADVFGSKEAFQQQFTDARTKMMGVTGINQVPGLDLNPNASNVVKLNTLLRYYTASALAGQSGRDLSDKDLKQASELVGDPSSWLQGPTRYTQGLKTILDEAGRNMSTIDQQLNSNNIRPDGQSAQAPAQQGAPTVEKWERAPDGTLRKVQ